MSRSPVSSHDEERREAEATATQVTWRRVLGRPQTAAGIWSLGLLGAFVVLMVGFYSLVAAGQRGGETFFSNPYLAVPILLAAGSALGAGATAALAIFRRKERSLFAFASLLVGLLVLVFILAEIRGH